MNADEPESTTSLRISASGEPDALATIQQLFEDGFVDGLVRRLDRGWSLLDRGDVEDVVSDALLALYETMAAARKVGSAEAYVFKVAANRAKARYDEIKDRGSYDEELLEDPKSDALPQPGLVDLRTEALRIARQLLPRLGQSTIQRVMGLVFEAVEADLADISPSEIAEVLGLSSSVVRQTLHRGFQRLQRIAQEEGLQLNFEDVLGDDTFLLDNQEVDDDDDE
jgi:RNA polymerase sigma factor (sigma-70 family)